MGRFFQKTAINAIITFQGAGIQNVDEFQLRIICHLKKIQMTIK